MTALSTRFVAFANVLMAAVIPVAAGFASLAYVQVG